MAVVYDPRAVFEQMSTLIESDPAMYTEGFLKGIEKINDHPYIQVQEIVDDYPDSLFDQLDVDTQSPEFERHDLVHAIGLFCAFITVKTAPVVEGVQNV